MDNKILKAFSSVDWVRLRRDFADNVVEIGAKINCKPFWLLPPTLIYPKYTGSLYISDDGKTIVDRGITGRTQEDIDVNIIERSKDYKKLIKDTYKEFAHLETHLQSLFDYYKDTDRYKAIFAQWANKICEQYHNIYPPQVATLPDWAQSTDGAQILNKLVIAGYCSHVGQLYQWNKTKRLWAFFADEISDALNLRGSNDNIPFEIIAEAFTNVDYCEYASQQVSKYTDNNKHTSHNKKPNGWERLTEVIYKD